MLAHVCFLAVASPHWPHDCWARAQPRPGAQSAMIGIRPRYRPLRVERLEDRLAPAVVWRVAFDDPGGTNVDFYPQIRANLLAAGADWSRYFIGANASIEVTVELRSIANGHMATAESATSVFDKTVGDIEVWEAAVAHEIRTGVDANGGVHDAIIRIDPGQMSDKWWFDPTPSYRDDEGIPYNKLDAYSIFLHEIGHILGFNGWRDWTTGQIPDKTESRFDSYVTIDADGTPFFNGPAARSVYGNRPVPLTYGNLFHVGNMTSRPGGGPDLPGIDLANDLMNGMRTWWATRNTISPLDLAVLRDLGLPLAPEPVSPPTPLSLPLTNSPWHNSVTSEDVNGDGRITALDALLVINVINTIGPGDVPWPQADADRIYFIDVDSDNTATALDALLVINHINENMTQRKATSN